MNNDHIIYKELSYKIVGVIIRVHKELGPSLSEKQYGDRLAQYFKEENINFEREYIIPISFEGEQPGRNKADLIIEGKVILENKTVRMLTPEHYYQVQRYLKATNKNWVF